MRQLKLRFEGKGEVRGSEFHQILASGHGYVYQVTTSGYDNQGNDIKCKPYYEVMKKKVNERFQSISYPKSNHFGVWAWTATSMDKAFSTYFEKVHPKTSKS